MPHCPPLPGTEPFPCHAPRGRSDAFATGGAHRARCAGPGLGLVPSRTSTASWPSSLPLCMSAPSGLPLSFRLSASPKPPGPQHFSLAPEGGDLDPCSAKRACEDKTSIKCRVSVPRCPLAPPAECTRKALVLLDHLVIEFFIF